MSLRKELVRRHVAKWLKVERKVYADIKYSADNERMVLDQVKANDMAASIEGFVGNYLSRVKQFGFDSPQGRQALGKACVTLMAYMEHAVTIHGDMPMPGVSSGELEEWEGEHVE